MTSRMASLPERGPPRLGQLVSDGPTSIPSDTAKAAKLPCDSMLERLRHEMSAPGQAGSRPAAEEVAATNENKAFFEEASKTLQSIAH
jgi:hypothetical protein